MKSMRFHYKFSFLLAALLLLVAGGPMQGFGQLRYSANVVAYSDADFVAGSNLVANPLDAGNNALSNLFAGVPSGSYFLPWDPLSQTFGLTNHYTTQSGWTDGAATLRQPAGGFLWLTAAKRISFVGEPWSPICVTFPEYESVVGFMPQYACPPCPFVSCSIDPPNDTVVLKWDRQEQHWRAYAFLGADSGWYPDIVAPTLAPDEAAIVNSWVEFTARTPGFYAPFPVQLARASSDGTNFVFQFASPPGVSFSVQRSTNLVSDSWRTIHIGFTKATDGLTKVTVPLGTGDTAFYRLETVRLVNPSRTGIEFRFQFYTEPGTRYQVSRKTSLSDGAWLPVLSIEGTGALTTAIDSAATNPTAYYRVEY